MTTLGPLSSLLANTSLLKAGGASSPSVKKEKLSPGAAILAAIEKSDPEKASALKKKLEEAQGLLQRAQASKVDLREQRKAAAQEKIQRIKEKLAMLRIMASINPEAAARQAKQLARELAQAVREYSASKGGGGAATNTAAADALSADTSAAAPPAVASAETTEVASPAATAVQGSISVSQNTGAAEKEDNQKTSATEDQDKSDQDKSDRSGTAQKNAQEDSEFAREVKEIKNALKRILDAAKRRLAEKGEGNSQHTRNADNALMDVDRALSNMTAGGISFASALDIFA